MYCCDLLECFSNFEMSSAGKEALVYPTSKVEDTSSKRIKLEDKSDLLEDDKDFSGPKRLRRSNNNTLNENEIKTSKMKFQKCPYCKQGLDNVPIYNGHPNNSMEEFIALTDLRLSPSNENEYQINNKSDFPAYKITHFSVYDEEGHLCPFDTGLIEADVLLRCSGYIKQIGDEDPSTENGVAAYDLGPIIEWWTNGHDSENQVLIAFTTQFAQYHLMEASPQYETIFNGVREKIMIVKDVVDFLLDKYPESPSYEDLLRHIESTGEYISPDDTLIQNAQVVCDQVFHIDRMYPDEEFPLLDLPCMKSLVRLAGVTFKQQKIPNVDKGAKMAMRPALSKAVTTRFVQEFFEKILMENEKACESSTQQSCKTRKCSNMAIADSDNNRKGTKKLINTKQKLCSRKILHNDIQWEVKCDTKYKNNDSYSSVIIDDVRIQIGDFVTLEPKIPNEGHLCVAKVVQMYDSPPERFMFHGLLFRRGSDTILAETADPRELFLVDECEELPLGSISQKANVEYVPTAETWSELGGLTKPVVHCEDDGENFYFCKRYESNLSRFVDIQSRELQKDVCISCSRKASEKLYNTPIYDDSECTVKWKNTIYRIGSGVLLDPGVYDFSKYVPPSDQSDLITNPVDETLYPEYYRKKSDVIKNSNAGIPRPFVVGLIDGITMQQNDIIITVKIFWRPEDTGYTLLAHSTDLTLVYWSDQVLTTSFENVTGKCYIAFAENVESPIDWSVQGPLRFYFEDAFNPKTRDFYEVPSAAKKIGMQGKGKGVKSKGKASRGGGVPEEPPAWGNLHEPLRAMNIFAGCGGLSEGLHRSGVCHTEWAIEFDLEAAQTFRMNYPDAKVSTVDCNTILEEIMNAGCDEQFYPQKGQVDMLVGCPPCQGFSGENRFSVDHFKNSLLLTYLGYCEYYRPKYFILENPKNFVYFKRSKILKLTIACLIKMGYQVAWGVLQAGHYGVPQAMQRVFLIAAAPGYVLPRYPEPQHVFDTHQLSFVVDECRYSNGCEWTNSAPYRTICVRDAISDLPDIVQGWSIIEMPYDREAVSHYQRVMRGKEENEMVRDHICKEMSALIEARVSHIPTWPGSDWRDLPNISVKLNDGTSTNILIYSYRLKNQKSSEPPKGVCQCALGDPCDPTDRQVNTLIPWCLPHTADGHNNWAGLYGRLEWGGFFDTIITNPEPMGKEGRVLHPKQNRVVSVRECARCHGFQDKFIFRGDILDKHRQIGSAVPPPMGAALGREIKKAYLETIASKQC